MRIVRLTPEQARAVHEQLARIAMFARQVIDAFAEMAVRAGRALRPFADLSERFTATA